MYMKKLLMFLITFPVWYPAYSKLIVRTVEFDKDVVEVLKMKSNSSSVGKRSKFAIPDIKFRNC